MAWSTKIGYFPVQKNEQMKQNKKIKVTAPNNDHLFQDQTHSHFIHSQMM